jgi:transcriptional regulator with XRE-family HTH domain
VSDSSFAQRLQELREQAGLSQYEVAKRAGLTRQTLSRLEMGASIPSWPTVQALCRAIGVSCVAFDVDEGTQEPAATPRGPGRPRKATEQAPAKRGKKK